MKRILLACFLLLSLAAFSQGTYYWVGGNGNVNITTNSNWNTQLNGGGTSRSSATNAADILIFDGTNLGGATTVTGPISINANSNLSCLQMRFVNGADISMGRISTASPPSGTSTITIAGDGTIADDLVIDAGCALSIISGNASMRINMATTTNNSGRVSGTFRMNTTNTSRIDNGITGTGKLVFTSGASFVSNITGSSSYAFGNNQQSAARWAVFEAGSHLYYEGGNSPNASNVNFSPLDFKAGSTWHHRANNGAGSFFSRRSFADIIVENNATLTTEGSVYKIDNLTVTSGSTFMTASSGQTIIEGNLVADGTVAVPASSTSELFFAGNSPQTVSGTGTITTGGVVVAGGASVTLNKNITTTNGSSVYGKLNFGTNQITGTGSFRANGDIAPIALTASTQVDSFKITQNTVITSSHRGYLISGAGIAPNTVVTNLSVTGDTVYLSNPSTANGTGVALSISSNSAVLQTAHTNGFDPASGSVIATGTLTFDDGVSYIINGATAWPFGISTAAPASPIATDFVEITAPVTINRSFSVSDHLGIGGKLTLRPLDAVHVLSGASITGTFNSNNYIATGHNASNGNASSVQVDGISAATVIPVGSANNYLPVTLTPSSSSNFTVATFEGITSNGLVNGTALTPGQKQLVVNAVWNINRLGGSGNANIAFGWPASLEGSAFSTFPNSDIGIITNTGTLWTPPISAGDNTANTSSASVSSFGAFAIGSVPPANPFIFNQPPAKTYGDPDFNGGAISLNTTEPIVYSSNNPAVATIVAGNIHIVGAGTANITASQASDGFYPAASITRTLTVNRAALTITADNKTRFEQVANPPLTASYTGFVLGETSAVLTTPVVLSTTAVLASAPGTYPITASGATSSNYTITFVNGTMTVTPKQTQTITFNTLPAKTYGNADFAAGATSTNTTIPITYASSNPAVATIAGNNIHIVGAGTTNITASQAGNDGYFAATPVVRALTVNKAALTIRVRDTTRAVGQPNPPFTITYTGFVLGETATNLLTPVAATTTATINSSPGYYPITLDGATSNNYNITYVNARLTVQPANTAAQSLLAYMSNSTTLTVRIYSPAPALADIIVYDFTGRPLIRKNIFMPAGFISTDIAAGLLSSGAYIVTVKGDGVNLKQTIVIAK